MALKRNREAGEALLDKPRILSAEPGALSQWLFYGALLLLGTWGHSRFFGAFQVPVAPVPRRCAASPACWPAFSFFW